jgi:dienelactone hydrolase
MYSYYSLVRRKAMKLITGGILGLMLMTSSAFSHPIEFTSPSERSSIKIKGDLTVPADVAYKLPAVILLHDCGGLNKAQQVSLDHWIEWFNKRKFVTLTVDSLGGRDKTFCGDVAASWIAPRAADLSGAIDYLGNLDGLDPQRIYALGFGHGGSAIIEYSAMRPKTGSQAVLRGGVALYPNCKGDAENPVSEINYSMMLIVATKDKENSVQDCTALVEQSKKKDPSVDIEYNAINGAEHGWDRTPGPALDLTETALDDWLRRSFKTK